ncbi:hypothetical protein ACN47E_000148 [Coniothyrium glycines]
MSTIGFRFEDLASVAPKKSFFQRMNESHGTFISQMRSRKNNNVEERRLAHVERSRKRSSSSQSNTSVLSSTFPSTTELSRDLDHLEEHEILPRDSVSRQGSDCGASNELASPSKDRDHVRNVTQGMQGLRHWKQASYNTPVVRPFHISPPETPTSSHSWSSSISLASDMSDEQMEQWLEHPVDAETHRCRKSSAASSTTSVDSKFNVEDLGIKEYRCMAESRTPSVTTSIPEVDETDEEDAPSPVTEAKVDIRESTVFLEELAFESRTKKSEPFRFSAIVLNDFTLEIPPE